MNSEKLTRAEINKRYRERHPEKYKESQKKYREANKQYMSDRQRKYQLRDKYGITEDDYNQMLLEQDGKCAICETTNSRGKWERMAVDHCHQTGKVRGLLCSQCNRGVGLLKDSEELLIKAAEYLRKYK